LSQIFVVTGPPISAEMDLVMPYLLGFDGPGGDISVKPIVVAVETVSSGD